MTTANRQYLREKAEQATKGPWQIVERRYVDDGSGKGICGTVAERRIFTAWDHPQMRGPVGVVNSAVTIWPVEDSDAKATHLVSIDAPDADYIVSTSPDVLLSLLSDLDGLEQENARLKEALTALRIDANRLCDRNLGGTYEDDCRRAIKHADAALEPSCR